MLVYTNDPEFLKLDEDIEHLARVLFYLQLTQTVMVLFSTFVDYYKFEGPNTWIAYNKTMPYVHFVFVRAIFYVFPFIYIGIYIYAVFTTEMKSSYLNAYFALQMFTAFPLIYWYDNTI